MINRLATVLILLLSTNLMAEELESAVVKHLNDSAAVEAHETYPINSTDGSWAFYVCVIIGVMFLSAAVIGPSARANMEEEMPPTHAHDEPPGSSGHHGPSGTVDLNESHGH